MPGRALGGYKYLAACLVPATASARSADAQRRRLPSESSVSSTSGAIFPQILWESEFLAEELLSGWGIVHMCVKMLPLKLVAVVRKSVVKRLVEMIWFKSLLCFSQGEGEPKPTKQL